MIKPKEAHEDDCPKEVLPSGNWVRAGLKKVLVYYLKNTNQKPPQQWRPFELQELLSLFGFD